MAEALPAPAVLALVRRLLRTGRVRTVVLDGRSGSGKSTFATSLAAVTPVRLLRLDDVYPGWDGLEAGAAALVSRVLRPRAAGAGGTLRRWRWDQGLPGEPLPVPPGGTLVVEGCGALSRASARLVDLRIWIQAPDDLRRSRALARDGDVFAPHWERWARQERRLLAREDPRRLADVLLDGRTIPRSTPGEGTAGAQ